MKALRACIIKELLLLSRDMHGLALLFLMPLAFVVIMSFALQGQFAGRAHPQVKVLVLDADQSTTSRALLAMLADNSFQLITPAHVPDAAALDTQLRHGDYHFAIRINTGLDAQLLSEQQSPLVEVVVAADSSPQMEAMLITTLHAALGRERMRVLLDGLGANSDAAGGSPRRDVSVRHAYTQGGRAIAPTAVQQSVPAWLVFGAFFVVVPLSNTLIRERQQGTLRRLLSTNLSVSTLLLGKFIPYFLVNQLQVLTMLIAGRYLVPALGGETLHIEGAPLLALVSASLSVAATGWALLIAVCARTTEQATLLGGTGNILLAALGGIMVPKFIMPETMQQIAQWSPMSWGLEGMLDVLLRHGALKEILPEVSGLTLLGIAAMLLAWIVQARRNV